jgi:hypothetical protein
MQNMLPPMAELEDMITPTNAYSKSIQSLNPSIPNNRIPQAPSMNKGMQMGISKTPMQMAQANQVSTPNPIPNTNYSTPNAQNFPKLQNNSQINSVANPTNAQKMMQGGLVGKASPTGAFSKMQNAYYKYLPNMMEGVQAMNMNPSLIMGDVAGTLATGVGTAAASAGEKFTGTAGKMMSYAKNFLKHAELQKRRLKTKKKAMEMRKWKKHC